MKVNKQRSQKNFQCLDMPVSYSEMIIKLCRLIKENIWFRGWVIPQWWLTGRFSRNSCLLWRSQISSISSRRVRVNVVLFQVFVVYTIADLKYFLSMKFAWIWLSITELMTQGLEFWMTHVGNSTEIFGLFLETQALPLSIVCICCFVCKMLWFQITKKWWYTHGECFSW